MAYEKVEYNNKFNKDNYDRTNIFFPKGKKDLIKEHWKKKGYKSLNSYINHLIDQDMENSNERSNQGGGCL